ncbi:MAG: hypothetical protein A2233_00235 [Candidatus Kerfeldbacteria bacterium RIFOXYA2_FULL_38_24]|uniref:M23ase beta-sheet core domain-containing protein n=1 Tax=Candidatus Kerfeldbacteria bacterium RIFOXYB2_FULL_38_14 TaxID=1798547 RepID=A0A1G2B9Z4_9BACT|nr:MAG: hypothetical protein A2233_00235 [Candidatus Kerfeldbacteria bacterium RIFOXYA2_FULL_38_24]OGY86023.1 MAG: hypothetical protein A2319_00440 [Candidatus Kerfeldbacteria bacterium RIFOXYB2_FULL_38_14]OGY89477.1 MAG: hypothetical protein A2458_02645 [Candidatus Kerfeldbacteria bacterium RIFOXYC2_FULL_38_9]
MRIKKYLKNFSYLVVIFSLSCFFMPTLATGNTTDDIVDQKISETSKTDEEIANLQETIKQKGAEIEKIQQRLHAYQQQIDDKQTQALNLENQISTLDSKISSTSLAIEKTKTELEVTQSQIEVLHKQIASTQEDITNNKNSLVKLIRELHQGDLQSPIELVFSHNTLSDFYTYAEYTNKLQKNVNQNVQELQKIQEDLQNKRTELKDQKAQAALRQTDLETQQEEMVGEQDYKNDLLDQTQGDAEKFTALYEKARQDELQAEAEANQLTKEAQSRINKLKQDIQDKLQDEENTDDLSAEEQDILENFDGTVHLQWPISSRTITCGFHCAGYPFSGALGSHSAIDIATPQGTPILAADSGYVTRVVFDPNSSSTYGFIVILHGDNITSTTYGHISGANVSANQYVKKGDLIGWTGATPGTPGAGPFTTGPHLHFDVRKDGFPVNPLDYLP